MNEKQCFKCGYTKLVTDFYRHKQMPDGYVNKCKECTKKAVRDNYRKNIDKYKEYDKKRAMLPHRIEARKKYESTTDGKDALKKAKSKWLESNQIKRATQIIVGNAVRDGKLIKPLNCIECGSTGRIHGHHCDYAKPLDVMWLCPACHMKWHKINGEGLNG